MREQNNGICNFTGGNGLNYRLEIVAWGYDTAGVGYKITYENEAPAANLSAAISVESRVVGGPTNETVAGVVKLVFKQARTIYRNWRD